MQELVNNIRKLYHESINCTTLFQSYKIWSENQCTNLQNIPFKASEDEIYIWSNWFGVNYHISLQFEVITQSPSTDFRESGIVNC